MKPMTRRREGQKRRELGAQVSGMGYPSKMLELMLAMDRMVVESSLRAYGLPRRERSLIRRHNRRLHHVVREHLPRWLETGRKRAPVSRPAAR